MAKKFGVALCSLTALLLISLTGAHAVAQEQTKERVFNLVVGQKLSDATDQVVVIVPPHIPAIEPGTLDLTLTLGYFNMERSVFKYDNIIYKATPENFFYGNVELKNQTGFNPILRLGYTLTTWLALEAQTGVTFSEYKGAIASPHKINPRVGTQSPEEAVLSQFDPENRSTFIWINNLNVLWYPLNMDGDGRGRLHPYLTGGIGHAHYEIDSSYTNSAASSMNINAGLGLRLIADRLISIRAELVYQHHQIQFKPAEVFDERDQGTVQVSVYEFDELGNYSRVSSYPRNTMAGLTMQVGFSAKF